MADVMRPGSGGSGTEGGGEGRVVTDADCRRGLLVGLVLAGKKSWYRVCIFVCCVSFVG